MNNIRIAIVDDQQLFRQGIASIIHTQPGFELCIEADNGASFIKTLQNSSIIPDIILADLEMPEMNGIALNEWIQENHPELKVIILSIHTKERLIAKMVQNGASGYLMKNCDKAELINAIKTTYNSGFYINMQVLRAIQNASIQPKGIKNEIGIPIEISPREKEVLILICQEHTNIEIADKLFISQRTVDAHRNNLLAKTGCRNTAGLVLFAIKHHLFEVIF